MNSFETTSLTDHVVYDTSTGNDLQISDDEVAFAHGFLYPSVYFGDWEMPVVSTYQDMPISQVQLMPSKAETSVPGHGASNGGTHEPPPKYTERKWVQCPTEKRSRVLKACVRCQTKRLRCTTNTPCGPCVDSAVECVCLEGDSVRDRNAQSIRQHSNHNSLDHDSIGPEDMSNDAILLEQECAEWSRGETADYSLSIHKPQNTALSRTQPNLSPARSSDKNKETWDSAAEDHSLSLASTAACLQMQEMYHSSELKEEGARALYGSLSTGACRSLGDADGVYARGDALMPFFPETSSIWPSTNYIRSAPEGVAPASLPTSDESAKYQYAGFPPPTTYPWRGHEGVQRAGLQLPPGSASPENEGVATSCASLDIQPVHIGLETTMDETPRTRECLETFGSSRQCKNYGDHTTFFGVVQGLEGNVESSASYTKFWPADPIGTTDITHTGIEIESQEPLTDRATWDVHVQAGGGRLYSDCQIDFVDIQLPPPSLGSPMKDSISTAFTCHDCRHCFVGSTRCRISQISFDQWVCDRCFSARSKNQPQDTIKFDVKFWQAKGQSSTSDGGRPEVSTQTVDDKCIAPGLGSGAEENNFQHLLPGRLPSPIDVPDDNRHIHDGERTKAGNFRKRREVACGRCRRKKIKCSGQKPCQGCLKACASCEYAPRQLKRKMPGNGRGHNTFNEGARQDYDNIANECDG